MATAALRRDWRPNETSLFGAVVHARLASARGLSDTELAELERSTGSVGLIAKHVRSTRRISGRYAFNA